MAKQGDLVTLFMTEFDPVSGTGMLREFVLTRATSPFYDGIIVKER